MNKNQKESLKFCLRGKGAKLSFQLVLSRICSMIFILYCFSVFYLLIFDTSFIVEIGLYENKFVAALVCFSAVMIGFILLLVTVFQKHTCKLRIYSAIDRVEIRAFNINYVLKHLVFKLIVTAMKISYFVMGVLPSALLSLLCYKLLSKGISVALLVILSVCGIVLLINGVSAAVSLIQQMSLCDFCFAENENMSIREIIKESAYLSDGKCSKLAKYKSSHIIFRLLGTVVPYFSAKETAAEFIVVTDKIIPYAHKKAHTEKSVVFYIGKRVNAG